MIDTKQFTRQGYFTYAFENVNALVAIRQACEQIAKNFFGDKFKSLDSYHQIDVSPKQHDEFQYAVFSHLNQSKMHHQFVQDNLSFFTHLFGQDIDVQTNLYLRIARPYQALDNIGIHRDTDYGNSAYEMSLSLPLVSQVPGCGLNVLAESHLESEHQIRQFNREDVIKGTPKNEMGFLYAPKEILGISEDDMECISLPFGSGIGFTLGLIHGQKVNKTQMTRWSIDFRLKNTFHPLTKNLKQGYYVPLHSSVISKLASKYYEINEEEKKTLVNDDS